LFRAKISNSSPPSKNAYTAQAAQTSPGRPLAAFYMQDEDLAANGSADANFLAQPDARPHRFNPDSGSRGIPARKSELLWPAVVTGRLVG